MSHLEAESLALRALGETGGAPPEDAHLAACPHCQSELRQLTAVVALARQADAADRVSHPSPEVWARVAAAALGSNGSAARAAAGAGAGAGAGDGAGREPARGGRLPRPAPDGRAARHRGWGSWLPRRSSWQPRRPLAAALAGAVAGLIIGAGSAVAIHERDAGGQPAATAGPRVVARIALRPLPEFPQWRKAAGLAVMEATSRGPLLTVRLSAPRRPGFYEVWLLARNGVSMISLGDLDSAHTGEFSMPPGVDLRNYSRIDISLQPYNGSPVHSPTSVVRGSLPQ
ncbi:MAG: anti-sigma factor [Streptosporangiaceae bacterium]